MSDSKRCWDFNIQGLCRNCGKRRQTSLSGRWPSNTWFQNRRALQLQCLAIELPKKREVPT